YRYWMHRDGDHNVHAHYGVRTKRYTLIHFYGKALGMKGAKNIDTDPEWELFDRDKDPQQMKNVYADPAYGETVKELKAELQRLGKPCGDNRGSARCPSRKDGASFFMNETRSPDSGQRLADEWLRQ